MQNIGWLELDPERKAKLIRHLELEEEMLHRTAFRELRTAFILNAPECRNAVYEAEEASAKAAGHEPKNIGMGMSDQFQCACGWESNSYWDGDLYALEEWRWHMLKEGVVVDFPGYPQYEPLIRFCELQKKQKLQTA